MTPRVRDRRGLALLLTLAVLSLLGVLTVATTMAVRSRMAGARRLRAVHSAALATGRTLDSALAAWPAAERGRMAVGDALPLPASAADRLSVARLSTSLFRLDAATARGDPAAGARHAAALLVWIDRPRADERAPLAAGDAVSIGPDFVISSAPAAGSGCAPADGFADVLAADAAAVRWAGPAGSVREDPALADADAFARVGALPLDSLEARADVVLPDGARWSPSPGAMRVVVARGDLTVDAGRGSGILVVRGALVVAGPLAYSGLIVAVGGVRLAADDVDLAGALRSGGPATLERRGALRADPCAVARAAVLAGRAVPLHHWSRIPLR